MTVPNKVESHERVISSEVARACQPQNTFLDEKLARIEAIDLEKQDYKPDNNSEAEADLDALIRELNAADADNEADELMATGKSESAPPGDMLQTDITYGLSAAEVARQRKTHGLNQLREEKENPFLKFIMFFVGPIQFVMEAAAVLAAGLKQFVDFGVICALLILNALVGFAQEFQAGSIVKELKKTLASKAVVLREGHFVEIEALLVVPGDILRLEEGTIIAADGRLVSEEAFLQVDQSSITGESLAIDKINGDICYASSTVRRGKCLMMVTATGGQSFVGRAATLVNKTSNTDGHFTKVLANIGSALLGLVIFTLLIVFISSFYRNNDITIILRFTLAITVVGVPVGLPAVVTTTMAVGAAYLAKKDAIIRKLSAIESLAGVEILCTDKTGTLTRNKLSIHEPYCSMDAIDKAFFRTIQHYPRARALLTQFKCINFTPFDPVSKKVVALVQTPQGEHIMCVKGAPSVILEMVESENAMSPEATLEYRKKIAEFAARGFRSLGIARRKDISSKWEMMGIVPCTDPPRHDTAKTVNEAKLLGLSIKMLTGDAVEIAIETSRQLGLGTGILNAEALNAVGDGHLPESAVYDFVEKADGFAKVFPQHKFDVVRILQKRGFLVAMTGDGVNDAPSLKKADTGIAVEGSSDAARSAADIVFLAPGLSAIIDAIKVSRQIFHRMHAYVIYRIALSLHLEIFFGLWITALNQTLDLQLTVFIAIFADLATLAIAYDNAPYSITPVDWNLRKVWSLSIVLGIILAAGTCIALSTILASPSGKTGIIEGYGNTDAVLFLQICLTENWLIFITRCKGPFWSSIPSWQLSGAIALVDVLATLFCIFGWFVDGQRTSLVTVARVWIYSFGIFCVMAGVYYLLQDVPLINKKCVPARSKVHSLSTLTSKH